MDINEVWLNEDVYERKMNYLVYSFERIDSELYASFDYVPLRKQNLEVSSMFFADICLRLYSILTIGFITLTFGHRMKEKIAEWKRGKENEKFHKGVANIHLDNICTEIIQLKIKNLDNKDGIRDYLKFYQRTELGISEYFDVDGIVEPLDHVGKIKLDEKIKPFDEKLFMKYLDIRNSIVHRGKVEATLKEAFHSMSALYLILRTPSPYGHDFEFKSHIFGNMGRLGLSYPRRL